MPDWTGPQRADMFRASLNIFIHERAHLSAPNISGENELTELRQLRADLGRGLRSVLFQRFRSWMDARAAAYGREFNGE